MAAYFYQVRQQPVLLGVALREVQSQLRRAGRVPQAAFYGPAEAEQLRFGNMTGQVLPLLPVDQQQGRRRPQRQRGAGPCFFRGGQGQHVVEGGGEEQGSGEGRQPEAGHPALADEERSRRVGLGHRVDATYYSGSGQGGQWAGFLE
ncbi:MAG TPA: hypothetical protein DCW72_10640 [Elusimicrobia bacterium]|nr:hypothetical protein [Elusimicrobiota bacterium]